MPIVGPRVTYAENTTTSGLPATFTGVADANLLSLVCALYTLCS